MGKAVTGLESNPVTAHERSNTIQKRLSESIGHYLSLPDKKYREKVMKLLRSGKIDPNSTIGKYMPDEEEIPR